MDDLENLSDAGEIQANWPWKIFVFSLVLFGTVVGIYLGLIFGYRPYLTKQIAQKDQEILNLARSIPEAEQQELIRFYSQLSNLQVVLGQHVMGSKLLPVLEKATNQRVYYTVMNLNVDTRELLLEGVARSYEVLAQQIESFKRLPEIERLIVNFSDARANNVNFGMVLTFKQSLLK